MHIYVYIIFLDTYLDFLICSLLLRFTHTVFGTVLHVCVNPILIVISINFINFTLILHTKVSRRGLFGIDATTDNISRMLNLVNPFDSSRAYV